MRFLYIAPRYHNNQIPIMNGLKQRGHEIVFLSQYAGDLEDYSVVKPIIVGYSPIYLLFDSLYVRIMGKRDAYAHDKKIKYGMPRLLKLAKHIKESKADVAILRERSVYSIFSYWICRYYGVPAILYNQSPLWEDKIKNDFAHRLMRRLTPKVRMTPVLGIPNPEKIKEPGARFVPFVMEPADVFEKVKEPTDDTIEIFCIGKYEKRKNHRMMLEVVELLSKDKKIHLTIAGECTSAAHQEYYKGLRGFIEDKQMEETVTLLKNLSREQVNTLYRKADLFVIPSTAEPASISQLEAMAYALPVICSDKNGTACYVEDCENGYLFLDNDVTSLRRIMEKMLEDTKRMEEMGKKSLYLIKEKYQIDIYLEGIGELLADLEKINKKKRE